MSAFNNARYNLSEFNRQAEDAIWIVASLVEKVNFVAATSETRYTQFEGNEVVQNDVKGAKGLIKPVNGAEEKVTCQAVACSFFIFSFEEKIETASRFEISFHAFMNFEMLEKADCLILESACNWLYPDISENVVSAYENGFFPWSQFFYSGSEGIEIIDGNLSVEAYDEYICNLSDITLRPGDVLVIDSGNYDIWLNKENAIYYQSGDWIDEVSRLTRTIKIIADYPGNLSATVLYTERYL